MKITNIEKGPRGVNTVNGPVLIEPGQTVDVELSDVELKVAKATGWFETDRGGKAKAQESALKAVHYGGGKFNIMRGDEVLATGLSKGDADGFNSMSDDDKAAYVEAERSKI